MQPIRSRKYVLGAALFAIALAGTGASQAESPEKSLSESAALAIQDNVAKIMAHQEATNPVVMMRPMTLLHARCDLGHRPAQGASAANHAIRDNGQ